ncbi:MAG TPA: hypothetical protein VHV26_12240 [Rhizomicrobium sp.]|jgi:hypothetical protein|nr:hypothetical protein [Rhizomicrobium sp.]
MTLFNDEVGAETKIGARPQITDGENKRWICVLMDRGVEALQDIRDKMAKPINPTSRSF